MWPSSSGRCAPAPTWRPGCTPSGLRATSRSPRRTPTWPSWRRRNAALKTLGVDLAITDGCAGTDLVHSHTWYANFAGHLAVAAVRRAPRRHRPLARAPATVEGRAARRRLRPVVVGGADLLPRRERGGRGVGGDARRRAGVVPRHRPGQGPRRPQRHRHRAVAGRPEPGPGPRARRRPRPPVGGVRRPDHPAEGPPALPARGRAAASRGADRAVRRSAGHPGDRGRGGRPGRRCSPRPAREWCGSGRCCPGPTWSRC